MTGYYRMARGWLDHPVFAGEAFSRHAAWAWLIENAAWKAARVNVGTRIVQVERGQLCFSLRYMGRAWRWDEAKVRRFIARLVREKMIVCVADAGQCVLTICNYNEYQADQQVADAGTAASSTQERRSGDANKKEGKELKEKESMNLGSAEPIDIGPKAWGSIDGKSPIAVADAVFETYFWPAFPPKRGNKEPAKIKFRAALKVENAERIIAGLGHYIRKREAENEPQYTQRASSWLHKRGWQDENAEFEECA